MTAKLTQKEREQQLINSAAKRELAHELLNLEENTDAELRERLQDELELHSEILEGG